MKSNDIRKKFQNYFTAHSHKWIPSSTLIPDRDPSLLFTNAGMNQFRNFFLAPQSAPHSQVSSIQKCLRAGGKHNDLEQVGYSAYHHTFFEMMGNFSFGSYFKKEAIDYAMNFLTKELGLSKDRLWVSVFKEDKESAEIWKREQGFPEEKIFHLGEDNFWRMGDTGPCGPCSEIYYYEGSNIEPGPEDMTEIWNLVFMEFNEVVRNGKKVQEPLPKPCVDTGMGLERLSAVLQEKKSNYHTDIFKDIIISLEKASGVKYHFTGEGGQETTQVAFRVIADHSRAVSFLICDGILPGSEGASYVLRRILRRALFYSYKLQSGKDLLFLAVKRVIDIMSPVYPGLKKNKDFITHIIKEENNLFSQSLKEGQNIFFKKIKNLSDKKIPNEIVWKLYDTYGFPPDLTRLIAKEKGFEVNENINLEEFKQQHISRFRKNSILMILQEFISAKQFNPEDYKLPDAIPAPPSSTALRSLAPSSLSQKRESQKLPDMHSPKSVANGKQESGQRSVNNIKKTEFTGYNRDNETARILYLLFVDANSNPSLTKAEDTRDQSVFSLDHIKKEQNEIFKIEKRTSPRSIKMKEETKTKQEVEELWLIADKTCFYPEGGGPVGDTGTLETKTGKALVLDCQKTGPFIVHKIKIATGELQSDQTCKMKVDPDHRRLISTSHSATHLLNQALREILGSSIRQMGSLVEPGKLRFDFSHPKPLSTFQIEEIENTVRGYIQAGHSVSDSMCSYEQAVDQGAIFLAGENYGEKVRTIRIGKSFELCGGIHVKNTSGIGDFKIISETGVQSGVRRITAYTGDILQKWLSLLAQQNKDLRNILNIPLRETPETQNPFIQWLKAQEEETKNLKTQLKLSLLSNQTSKNKTISKEPTKTEILMDKNKKLQTREPDQQLHSGYDKSTSPGNESKSFLQKKRIYPSCSADYFLARQNEELRKYLNLSLPRIKNQEETENKENKENKENNLMEAQHLTEAQNPFILFIRKKETEITQIKKQIANISDSFNMENIIKKAKSFQHQKQTAYLLMNTLPIEDKKLLADMADQLKCKLPGPAVVIVAGEKAKGHPIVVTVSKELQTYISAGDILKNTLAPRLNGKGGGQARFAQGIVKNKTQFMELEKILLEILHNK